MSGNRIARSVNVSRSVVQNYVKLSGAVGLSYERACELSESEALRLIGKGQARRRSGAVVPDWGQVNKELLRKGVTLSILWEEYRAKNLSGYSYSNFCVEDREINHI